MANWLQDAKNQKRVGRLIQAPGSEEPYTGPATFGEQLKLNALKSSKRMSDAVPSMEDMQSGKAMSDEQMMQALDFAPMGIGSIMAGRKGIQRLASEAGSNLNMDALEASWKKLRSGSNARREFDATGAQRYRGKEGIILDDMAEQFDRDELFALQDYAEVGLSDILKPDSQLLKAYPEIGNMRAWIDNDLGEGVMASYQPFISGVEDGIIRVNPKLPRSERGVNITHELQHAVDDLDRMAGDKTVKEVGSSTDNLDYAYDAGLLTTRIDELTDHRMGQDKRNKLFKTLDEYYSGVNTTDVSQKLGNLKLDYPGGYHGLLDDVLTMRPFNRYLHDGGEFRARKSEDMYGTGETFLGDVANKRTHEGYTPPSDRIRDLMGAN